MKDFQSVVQELPAHLRQYVVDQDYSRYTSLDQATWRFILRQLKAFLSVNAHESYVEGLEKTGISVERIPHIELMCEKLQEFGWTAVPVSGFIPPAAFMEMQSLGILPIASDMRSLENLLYTPAPDIVHEAAGHAPILVNPQFAAYLKEYAQVSKKAIISSEDLAQYEAIRDLSDIKESATSTDEEIAAAEQKLQETNQAMSHVSEAALLGRMNWWTAEYGLIGELNDPKIFGAGLLSSIGEARECLSAKVKKIPLSVDCVDVSYDITEPQPQLFVAKNFKELTEVLRQLEERLAFRKGGRYGLEVAQRAKTVNTVQLNSGLQISGKISEFLKNDQGEPIHLKFSGPVQLSDESRQIFGQGPEAHAEGFSSPVGKLKGLEKCLSEWTPEDLQHKEWTVGQKIHFTYESGIHVQGEVIETVFSQKKKLLLLCLKDARVSLRDQVLFDPSWGRYDMAVGSTVTSVFGGPADRKAYTSITEDFKPKVIPRKKHSAEENARFNIYQTLRDVRELRIPSSLEQLSEIFEILKEKFPQDWLAFLELYEISFQVPGLHSLQTGLLQEPERLRSSSPQHRIHIELGLQLADRVI